MAFTFGTICSAVCIGVAGAVAVVDVGFPFHFVAVSSVWDRFWITFHLEPHWLCNNSQSGNSQQRTTKKERWRKKWQRKWNISHSVIKWQCHSILLLRIACLRLCVCVCSKRWIFVVAAAAVAVVSAHKKNLIAEVHFFKKMFYVTLRIFTSIFRILTARKQQQQQQYQRHQLQIGNGILFCLS